MNLKSIITMGAPKKHLFPLLIILSLSFIFIYTSYRHSPLSSATKISKFNLPLPTTTAAAAVAPPNFTLIIKVLTFNRLPSLSRCLRSLSAADYLSNAVHLHVYIDHIPIDDKGSTQKEIVDFVDGFEWKFGNKLVHYRTGNVGLQAQWLEAWWPSSDHEFAFVVEDDLEVSPLFYKFLRGLIVNYYFNASNFSPYIYGASLQRPRFVPGKHGNKINLDGETRLFLYQLVGTWGQLLFPKPWKEFRLWYDKNKAMGIKPIIDGMVTTGWYKKLGDKIWTPWFIKFIHSRGYYNFYTNFQHERALSVSHRDPGVNYGKTAGPDSQLLDERSLDFNFLEMLPLIDLKWYDFCFREIFPGRIVRSLDELESFILSMKKLETVRLLNLFEVPEAVARNLLCHLERLNIQNYILMGPHSGMMFDFARRGHPIIDADQFFDSIESYRSIKFQDPDERFVKESLVKTYMVKKCLQHGHNTFIMDANILFIGDDLFLSSIDPTHDFAAGKSVELLFVRNSPSAKKIWSGDFLNKAVQKRKFVRVVVKLLEQSKAKMGLVDETSLGLKISTSSVNQSSLEDGKKIVYWSSEMGLDSIQNRLKELNLWAVDGDLSCNAVVCHQS